MRDIEEIEKAINFTKKLINQCETMAETRRRLGINFTIPLTTEIHKTILKCLEEKQEREQGRNKNCDSCIHANEMWNLEPCVSCKAIQMTNWEGLK